MTNFNQKVVAALSAGVLLLGMTAPVFADTTLVLSGNGSDSSNQVNVAQTSSTTVVQSNSANVTNHVDSNADSGNNDASRNTGGATTIDTGNAKTNTTVSNALNSNAASVSCCSAAGDTSVLISGNGSGSQNGVDLTSGSESNVAVYQDNNANVKNDVDAHANTGKNDAKSNTGGDVTVSTGDATTNVTVNTTANANVATVGGNGSNSGTGSVDLKILGNGTDSSNNIDLSLDHNVALEQTNSARVDNNIDAKADTGKNDADRNTGGDVTIDTGNALTNVNVDNTVNFNYASVDCGCLMDVTGKIAGNGYNTDNNLSATLGSDQAVYQDNCGQGEPSWILGDSWNYDGCKLNNNVDANAKSGENKDKSNTGSVMGGDPSVYTGNAQSNTDISNSGNANAYGVSPDFTMPSFDFNFNVSDLNMTLGQLLALIGH